MDKLIKSSKMANQALYFSILDDAAARSNCADDLPALLADVPELRMDIKFILVDLQTLMISSYKADRFYEKRYHLKNLYAGMLEGYKLLYEKYKKYYKKNKLAFVNICCKISKSYKHTGNGVMWFLYIIKAFLRYPSKGVYIIQKASDKKIV